MERADMELDAVAMRRRFVPRASRPGGAFGPGSEIGVVLIGRMRARKRHGRPSGSLGLVVDGLPGMTRGQPGIFRCLPARESRAQPLPTWAWSGFHGRALWRTGAGADIVTKRRVADGDGTAVDETEGKVRGVEAMSAGFGWRLGVTCSWWAQAALIRLPWKQRSFQCGPHRVHLPCNLPGPPQILRCFLPSIACEWEDHGGELLPASKLVESEEYDISTAFADSVLVGRAAEKAP